MNIIINIIYAILLISGGYALIKYRRNVKSWTGNWIWAETYLWSGWTYIVLILIGLFMIFLGALYPFGGMELIIGKTITNTPMP